MRADRATLQALRDMQTVMTDTKALFESAFGASGKATSELQAGAAALKEWNYSLEDVVEGTEDTLDKFKLLIREGTKLSRISDEQMKDTAQVEKLLRAQLKALKELHAAGVLNTEEAKKNETVMLKLEAAIDGCSTGASDLVDLVREVGKESLRAGRAVTEIRFEAPIAGASKLGETFNVALKAMTKLDDYGFKGMFGRISSMRVSIAKMREDAQKMGKEKLSEAKKIGGFAKKDVENLVSGSFKDRRVALKGVAEKFGATTGVGKQDEMLKIMSGRTGMVGGLDRWLTKKAMAAASGAGGGGMMGGLIGRVGGAAMSAGGGASVMGGLGSIAGRMAGPASAIMAVLEVLQKGFDRKKDIFDKLGKGGLIAGQGTGDLAKTYDSWSSALTPEMSRETARWGISFEKNVDAIKEVVESGINISGIQAGHEKEGVTGVLNGGRANDLYSGIMRNAYMFGKPLGMSETEGAQTTMKFIKDFSLSVGETEEMFKKMNASVKLTGMSTTAYLGLLDSITSSFDKMNKSLHFTTNLINILGKGAKYTNDDLREMVKGIMGPKKDLTIGTFAFNSMKGEDRAGVTKTLVDIAKQTGAEMEDKIGKGTAELSDEKLRQRGSTLPEGQRIEGNALIERYIAERASGRRMEAAGNDPMRMAAAMQASNSPTAQMAQNMSLLKFVAGKSGGRLSDFAGTDEASMQSRAKMESNPLYAEIAKVFNLNVEELTNSLGKGQSQFIAAYRRAVGTGPDAEKAQKELNIDPNDPNFVALREFAEKGDIADSPVMKKLLESPTTMSKVIKSVGEDAARKAEELARKNQAFISGPLDYIKRMLDALVSNIINIVSKLATLIAEIVGETEEEKIAKKEKWGADFSNEGQTLGTIKADAQKLREYAGKDPEKLKLVNQMEESMKTIEETAKKQGLTDFSSGHATRAMKSMQEMAALAGSNKVVDGKLVPKTKEEAEKDKKTLEDTFKQQKDTGYSAFSAISASAKMVKTIGDQISKEKEDLKKKSGATEAVRSQEETDKQATWQKDSVERENAESLKKYAGADESRLKVLSQMEENAKTEELKAMALLAGTNKLDQSGKSIPKTAEELKKDLETLAEMFKQQTPISAPATAATKPPEPKTEAGAGVKPAQKAAEAAQAAQAAAAQQPAASNAPPAAPTRGGDTYVYQGADLSRTNLITTPLVHNGNEGPGGFAAMPMFGRR